VLSQEDRAAGHKPDLPAEKVVTAARSVTSAASIPSAAGEHTAVDFAHLKRQLPMTQVVDHLGLKLRGGGGPQRRCGFPIHRGDRRGRTFSVNLDQSVFCPCPRQRSLPPWRETIAFTSNRADMG
jgi:hypothetical protein